MHATVYSSNSTITKKFYVSYPITLEMKVRKKEKEARFYHPTNLGISCNFSIKNYLDICNKNRVETERLHSLNSKYTLTSSKGNVISTLHCKIFMYVPKFILSSSVMYRKQDKQNVLHSYKLSDNKGTNSE